MTELDSLLESYYEIKKRFENTPMGVRWITNPITIPQLDEKQFNDYYTIIKKIKCMEGGYYVFAQGSLGLLRLFLLENNKYYRIFGFELTY